MSTAEIVPLPSTLAKATQTTSIEQSRAVAEVQAAIFVAQQFPRDMRRVWDEVRDACSRLALANKAFYAVPNRGNGPSVHLARAIIRIYGNADYGVRELSRDDVAGMSEIQSFAWDQQVNVRSTRTFQVPHERMKTVRKGQPAERIKLTDLGDVYLNNQNVGARAVRECIAAMLPTDLWDEAQRICRETLDKGDGKPLVDRINDMIAAFGRIGVTVAQIEARLERPRREWTGADVGQMIVAYQSVQSGDADKAELFPPTTQRVTAVEIKQAAPAAEPKLSKGQLIALHTMFGQLGMGGEDPDLRAGRLEYIASLGINVASTKDLTEAQAAVVLDALDARVEAQGGE